MTSEVEEKSTDGKLYSGLINNDGIVALRPPVSQAKLMVYEVLAANGHKVAGSTLQDKILTDGFTTDSSLTITISWRVGRRTYEASWGTVATERSSVDLGKEEIMNADQGPDLIERLNLSGEPFIPKLGVSGEMSPNRRYFCQTF